MSLASDICGKYDNQPDALIEILHDVQAAAGYIQTDVMRAIAEALNLSRAEVQGVVTFYEDFRLEPETPGTVKVCGGEACQAVGADRLSADLKAAKVPCQTVFCLGNCALGPAAMVEGDLIGRASVEKIQSHANHSPANLTSAKRGPRNGHHKDLHLSRCSGSVRGGRRSRPDVAGSH